MECAAVIDVVRVLGTVDDERYRLALELLGRVVAMLTRLCRYERVAVADNDQDHVQRREQLWCVFEDFDATALG